MKVLICGAGQVGYNIASYLADENNNVTIVDQDPELISQVNEDLDVNGIVGFASNPDTLSMANASDMDLMIAVTRSDEVNMVACQVGHSLFGIPKKIARIRDQSYRKAEWANLFSRTHMPIDVIISPEAIVAEDIYNRLSVPGTTYVSTLAEGKMHLIGAICNEDSPLQNTQILQIRTLFPELNFRIISILRRGRAFIPSDQDSIQPGDEFFFVADTYHLDRIMQAFAIKSDYAMRIVIAGGGNVGRGLAELVEERKRGEQLKIIEHNTRRAEKLSQELNKKIIVLNGSALEKDILDQAAISKVDSFIAVTNDDETNILSSLLAKQYGAKSSITLVNNSAYSPLVGPLGVDSMVSPRSLIVATIMQHVRRGRVKQIHNLRHGFFEVIEVIASESSKIANSALEDLDLPEDVLIAALIRGDEIVFPGPKDVVKAGDHAIVLSTQEQARRIEKLFSIRVDIF